MLFATCGLRHAFHALGRKLIEDLDTNVVVTHLLMGALDNISEALVPSCTMPQIPAPSLQHYSLTVLKQWCIHQRRLFIKLHLFRKNTKGEYLKEHQGAKGSKMAVNQKHFKSYPLKEMSIQLYPTKNMGNKCVSHPFQVRDGQLDLR